MLNGETIYWWYRAWSLIFATDFDIFDHLLVILKLIFDPCSEAGSLVDKFTALLYTFSRLNLNIDAYVCLKAITLLNFAPPGKFCNIAFIKIF